MWLEEYHGDGLRWDATAYIRNVYGNNNDAAHDIPDGWGLIQWINNEINAHQPWKISIAEDLRNYSWITRDTNLGGAGFDAQWNAGFVHPVRESIITADDGQLAHLPSEHPEEPGCGALCRCLILSCINRSD
jgi:1,4-alpha-glucan branching enzyme